MFVTRARDNSVLRRVLQQRRRPGRADLRRALRRDRRRGHRARPRPRLRGGAARRRRRTEGGRSAAACATCAGARSRGSAKRSRRSTSSTSARAGRRANGHKATGTVVPFVDELEQMRLALELGLRDYVDKNGFREIVVGVSGGIDSAVTAALAAEALGADRVHCVSMPSRYSSDATRADAQRLAESLGSSFLEIPIGAIVDAFDDGLGDVFAGTRRGPDGGEHPGACARRAADGAFEQVRLDARRDREQIASSPSATRRSTATWPVASRCSRTCTRPTSSGSRAISTSGRAAN